MKKNWFEILLYTYLIGGVGFIFLGPEPQKVGGRGYDPARVKGCYSNIRVLQGAVEMYNMDVATMATELDQNILISSKYLKSPSPLVCPLTSMGGTYSGKNLTEDGEIVCSYHGGLFAEGPYDRGEILKGVKKTPEQIEYERKKYIDNCEERIPYALFWPLFSYPGSLTTYCK